MPTPASFSPSPSARELAHRIGLQIDAVPQGLELRHQFIDAAVDADLMEAERGRQPGDAAADDDHLHADSCAPLQFGAIPASRMTVP